MTGSNGHTATPAEDLMVEPEAVIRLLSDQIARLATDVAVREAVIAKLRAEVAELRAAEEVPAS